jgi:hypothetical protein
MALCLPSEGVSPYGLSPGRADPTTKAARKGRVLTGLEVDWRKGDAKLAAEHLRRHNRSELREAAELLYAMAGIETEAGRRVYNPELAVFVVRAVTGNDITLTEVGMALTHYTGEKQASAVSRVPRGGRASGALRARNALGNSASLAGRIGMPAAYPLRGGFCAAPRAYARTECKTPG